jgi:hypothetical protein
MQASPWGTMDLNRKLMSYATETAIAPLSFVQKLSQANNLEDVVKIQTEFVKAQTDSFNESSKNSARFIPKWRPLRPRRHSVCVYIARVTLKLSVETSLDGGGSFFDWSSRAKRVSMAS